nr:hypothetical protein [Tanacetum cinerariifolium]
MDSNFNNDNEPWELSLDIDDYDLHLIPVLRPLEATPSGYCPNPVRIIFGPAESVEDVAEDDDFNSGAWVSATNYVIENDGNVTGLTMKDLSGTIARTVHHKVIGEGGYGNDIIVGAALILANVSVFSPNPSMNYLNITMRNVVKVFRKDTIPGSGSG